MDKLEELIAYYVNLLIIQYHNKPKARDTVRAFIAELLALYVLVRELEYAFDINKAVGHQLDIVGKYFGVVRKFVGLDFKYQYFSFQYQGGDDEGLSFNIIGKEGDGRFRTLLGEDTYEYDLDDDQFRDMVFNLLKDEVYVEQHPDMSIDYYFKDKNLLQIFETYDKLLPAPAGVKVNVHAMDEYEYRFTMKVLQSNGGAPYNAKQKGFQTLNKRIVGRWKTLPENQEEE